MVPLYSSHVVPARENESCIDETRGEAPELHFLSLGGYSHTRAAFLPCAAGNDSLGYSIKGVGCGVGEKIKCFWADNSCNVLDFKESC